jgi:hypothetical protein
MLKKNRTASVAAKKRDKAVVRKYKAADGTVHEPTTEHRDLLQGALDERKGTVPQKATQISARLNPVLHKAFRQRLGLEGLTQQEFLDAVIAEYVAGRLRLTKKVDIELHPSDELYFSLAAGGGYEADDVDDLMDQLEGRKKPRRIKR